jgi:hypothetical protein
MAVYHLSAKPIQRSKGRSATAAAAYRAGARLKDERTGEVHDYTRKQGVEWSEIVFPTNDPSLGLGFTCALKGEEAISREELWNMAEAAEKRKDGTTAREYEVAVPAELTAEQRRDMVKGFCQNLATKYGVVVDVAIHAPGREGDNQNHHAHILCTTRRFENGQLTTKADIELSDTDRRKKGLCTRREELVQIREEWAMQCNAILQRNGHGVRVDHRSLAEQGIDRAPTVHLGPSATAMERRGIKTDRGNVNRAIEQAEQAKAEVAGLEAANAGVQEVLRGYQSYKVKRAQMLERANALAEQERRAEAARLERERLEQERIEQERLAEAARLEEQKRQERKQELEKYQRQSRGMGWSR